MTTTGMIEERQKSRPENREFAPEAIAPTKKDSPISAATLLATESRVRDAANEAEVIHLIANELRKLISARQIFVFRASSIGELRIVGISSLAVVEHESACVRWIESAGREISSKTQGDEPVAVDLAANAAHDEFSAVEYPFAYGLWQPLRLGSGGLFGAILATREESWSEQEEKLLAREARVFCETWRALLADRILQPSRRLLQRPRAIASAILGLALLFPVPMTVLAPVEIVASEPQRVTAPLDGVIASVLVEPNYPVKQGQTILLFEQTTLTNRLQLAEQEVSVAKARLDRINQAAFHDDKARQEIGLAQAEYDLKLGERGYAAGLLARSRVVAERNGLLVYSNKDRLLGQPVKTGERLMQIVDPEKIEARVELATADAIALEQRGSVRLFLDAKPMSSLSGQLISEGYMAEPNATQQLVYTLRVALDVAGERPRIGSRGIAQLTGKRAPLFFFLFRRPIAAARQHLGL